MMSLRLHLYYFVLALSAWIIRAEIEGPEIAYESEASFLIGTGIHDM